MHRIGGFEFLSHAYSLCPLRDKQVELFVHVLVYAVEMFIQTIFDQQSSVCTSAVLLNEFEMKVSVFADFIGGLFRNFKHMLVLFDAKLVFDAVFSNVLFHNHIPFVICVL